MATEFIEIKHPRKTFIKGTLRGKYWADADGLNNSNSPAEHFNLNVYEAEIRITGIQKNEIGEFEDFKDIIPTTTKLPSPVLIHYKTPDFKEVSYSVNLNEAKLKDIILDKIVTEPNQRFGRIRAEIQGYILDETTEQVEVEIIETPDPEENKCIQDLLTGKTETKDRWSKRFIRYQFYNEDCTTYWSKWEFKENIEVDTGLWFGNMIIWLLLALFLFAVIKAIGWPALLIIGLLAACFYLFVNNNNVIVVVFQWIIRAFSLLFLIGLFGAFISLFKSGFKKSSTWSRNDYTHQNDKTETTDTITNNLIISHHRTWPDYKKKIHDCDIKVFVSDYIESRIFNQSLYNATDFKSLYSLLNNHDENGLDLIYKEFDRLRVVNNYMPRSKEFAELIVSCIQDIPYALVLQNSCNPYSTTDQNVKELLLNGCDCKPYISNGVQSPVEFMGNLMGDCDTRSLLLYKILNNFGYKTVLLASEYYKHAIIAVNIPNYNAKDLRIKYQNEIYHVWETTAPGVPIGMLSPEVDDLNLWSIYLN